MEASCTIIELKPNSRDRVEEWATFILSNENEALLTLENEKVTVENFFLATIDSTDYLICYMRAKSMKYAESAVKESLSRIDAYHQQFKKDCWGKGIKAELVLDLCRIDYVEAVACN